MKNIRRKESHLPDEAPVMVLPQATLFTRALMPLYIFEPRYRAMLKRALQTHRMFCVAMAKPGVGEAVFDSDFYHIAGLGLVRACVEGPDGTSRLILQGLARVEFVEFVQEAPYRIARIRELRTAGEPGDDLAPLFRSVLERARAIQKENVGAEVDSIEEHLATLRDPEALADLVAHSFVNDPLKRQQLLEELDVRTRLSLLLRHLESE